MNSVARFHWTVKRCGENIEAVTWHDWAFLESFMDHPLSAPSNSKQAACAQPDSAGQSAHTAPACRQLKSGQAITLRAKQPRVMRVVHGRVWVTLTDAGSPMSGNSRVLAGDHFLAPGDSLSLLSGQEIVIEAFGIGHAAPAYFNWECATDAAQAPLAATTALSDWQTGVVQPLHDLRRATGLMLGASGRLVRGLARGAAGAVKIPASAFAMLFVANNDRSMGAMVTFNLKNAKNAPVRAVPPSSSVRLAEQSNTDGLASARTQGCSA